VVEPWPRSPGVHIETLHKPTDYSQSEIELARKVAAEMNRGKLVVCAAPAERSE
jgi:hypothetical protein